MPRGNKRNKFGAVRTEVDGIKFHSKKEASRYLELKMLQADGAISELRLQVSYKITVNDFLICRYIADFVYIQDGKEIVEDVKGKITDVYRLKKKLMKACHGIDIYET